MVKSPNRVDDTLIALEARLLQPIRPESGPILNGVALDALLGNQTSVGVATMIRSSSHLSPTSALR